MGLVVPMSRDYVAEANEIIASMRHMVASQCTNCGFLFHNIYGTHDERGWWRRPKCRYNPKGWDAVKKVEGDSDE